MHHGSRRFPVRCVTAGVSAESAGVCKAPSVICGLGFHGLDVNRCLGWLTSASSRTRNPQKCGVGGVSSPDSCTRSEKLLLGDGREGGLGAGGGGFAWAHTEPCSHPGRMAPRSGSGSTWRGANSAASGARGGWQQVLGVRGPLAPRPRHLKLHKLYTSRLGLRYKFCSFEPAISVRKSPSLNTSKRPRKAPSALDPNLPFFSPRLPPGRRGS